jgi:hypothetical protein
MGRNRLRPGLKEPGFSFAKICLLNASRSDFALLERKASALKPMSFWLQFIGFRIILIKRRLASRSMKGRNADNKCSS